MRVYRVDAPHYFVAALFVEDGVVVGGAPILRRYTGLRLEAFRALCLSRGWHCNYLVMEGSMECLVCGSENMKGHVTLTYDVPMAARLGGIKIGGFKVTQMDLREAWEKLQERPVFCHECGQEHVYVVGEKEPLRVKDG